jgi:hypothetical protein
MSLVFLGFYLYRRCFRGYYKLSELLCGCIELHFIVTGTSEALLTLLSLDSVLFCQAVFPTKGFYCVLLKVQLVTSIWEHSRSKDFIFSMYLACGRPALVWECQNISLVSRVSRDPRDQLCT